MSIEGHALRRDFLDETKKLARQEHMEALEQRVYEHAGGVVEAILSFAEVTPGQTEPPPEWVEQYGAKGAERRLAVAKTGWLPPSVAPVGGKLAVQLLTGITKGRQHRNAARLTQNNINVRIALPAPTSREHPGPVVYEVRDLEE